MFHSDKELLQHILDEIEFLLKDVLRALWVQKIERY